MVDETPERGTDLEGDDLEEETGVGIGDDAIKSGDEGPERSLADDEPDHRSGLDTEGEN